MRHREMGAPISSQRGGMVVLCCVLWVLVALVFSPSIGWSQADLKRNAVPPYPLAPPAMPQLPTPAPAPEIAPPPALKSPGIETLRAGVRVFVKQVQVVGNTAFAAEQLKEVTSPYENRELGMEDLEALRLAVTVFYVKHGYVTSGALLPDQEIKNGVVTLQVIEGKLTDINIEGNRWFWKSYYTSRIRLGAEIPLNINRLQERLQLLQSDPRLQRVNAELKPGVTQDQSVLNVRVTEQRPFHLFFEVNNYQSPTVGGLVGLVTMTGESLLGLGDRLSVQYGRSEGVNPILNVRYEVPVTPWDTTLFAQYRRFKFAVKEGIIKELDVRSDVSIYTVGARHPLFRSIDRELALTVIGEHETNESSLLGEPFSFIGGSVNGQFKVSALRVGQEYVQRTQHSVLSLSSRFSIGIGVLDATTSNDQRFADGRFFAWLGQAHYLHTFESLHRTQLIGRTLLQVTPDHLFPLEQTSVGGRYTVRGYREYAVLGDNVVQASLEGRIPVFSTDRRGDILFLAPFADYGRAWNTHVANPHPQDLASVGVGMVWNIWEGSHFEVYWGHQLNHLRLGNGVLQDNGIHFQLVTRAF